MLAWMTIFVAAAAALPSPMPALSKRDAVATKADCPTSDQTIVLDASGNFFEVQCNTNYATDASIGSAVPTTDFQTCIDTCGKTSNCAGVTWFPTQGNCYLKRTMTGQKTAALSTTKGGAAYSALLTSAALAPTRQCQLTGWDCCALDIGKIPATTPDTAGAFASNAVYAGYATAAAVPTGYSSVFTNAKASTQQGGFRTAYLLDTYDVGACAAKCTADAGCLGFNVYVERDAQIRPANNICPNPASTALVKCALWGNAVRVASASNVGQVQAQFQVLIAASNGYNKVVTKTSGSSSSS